MNIIKKTALFFVLFLMQDILLAQTPSVCDSTNWAKPGTYEVINVPGSYETSILPKLNINSELLCLIERKRENFKVVNYQYSPDILIRIYPKNIKIEEEAYSK